MRLHLSPVLLCIIFFSVAVLPLPAQEYGQKPHTVRTKEKRYFTTGKMTIQAPLEQSRRVIEDTDQWNKWMFSGMDGTVDPGRFLLVYITGLEFTDENHMIVTVEFRFLRSLGKDPAGLPFSVYRYYGEDGSLERITAVLVEKNGMLESAQYEISITGNGQHTDIDYSAKVRLRGFFEFFVTLTSYKRTIEWYLQRIMANLAHEVEP